MIRLKKIQEPRMVSARIEREQFEKFKQTMGTQSFLTLQDFVVFAFQLFNDNHIVIDGKDFIFKP